LRTHLKNVLKIECFLCDDLNAIMVVHNHPSGNPEPSRADKEVTTKLIEAGNILDINLLDHLIIGNNQHYSFFDHGLIPNGSSRLNFA